MRPVAGADADRNESPLLVLVSDQCNVGRVIETPRFSGRRCGNAFAAEPGDDAPCDEVRLALAVHDIEAPDLAAQVRCVHAIGEAVTGEVDDAGFVRHCARHGCQLQVGIDVGARPPKFRTRAKVEHVDARPGAVRRCRVRGGVVHGIVAAADHNHGLVDILGYAGNVHFRNDRGRPRLTAVGYPEIPQDLRRIPVRDIERVIRRAAAAHAEDQLHEVAISRFDNAVAIHILDDRHDVAVEAVLLELRLRIEVQARQVIEQLVRDE